MDTSPNLLTSLGVWLPLGGEWMANHWYELMVVILLMLVLWAMVATVKTLRNWKRRRFLRMREGRMTPTEKAQLCKRIAAQGIHDYLFEAWCNGEITGDDYTRECRRYANVFDLSDLLPKQQKLLKTRMKERIKSLRSSEKPVIPGAPEVVKPSETVESVEEVKASSFMGGFLNWRKAS